MNLAMRLVKNHLQSQDVLLPAHTRTRAHAHTHTHARAHTRHWTVLHTKTAFRQQRTFPSHSKPDLSKATCLQADGRGQSRARSVGPRL